MKTYQEYYNEWDNSTESRDLAFDEWLMVLLARKEREMIDKACEWLKEQTFQEYPGAPHERLFDDYDISMFRKAMEK